MAQNLKSKFWDVFTSAGETFQRFPMVLAMALSTAMVVVTCIYRYNMPQEAGYHCAIFGMCTALGISLMFALKMLSQRIGRLFLLEILGCALLVGYYFIFPESSKNFNLKYIFTIVPTAILFHLFLAVAPFLTAKDEVSFWRYNKNLFVNFVLACIFSGVLILGFELAFVAVNQLFGKVFKSEIFPSTAAFFGIFGSAFVFLRFSGKGLPTLVTDGDYPVVLKFFVQYILIPLLLVYGVILYLYVGKILIRWELPKGWVSYLILSYSVVGILAILLVHPLISSSKSWVKGFSKIFYFTLIPLLVLLFIAIKTRILAYGFTEARYYLLLIAVWLAFVVAHFVIFRRQDIRFIPLSLLSFGIFALIFPYFNAQSVSIRSQKSELVSFFNEHKMLKNGKIDFSKPIADRYEIRSKMSFLEDRNQRNFLLSLLDADAQKKVEKSEQNLSYQIMDQFIGGKDESSGVPKNSGNFIRLQAKYDQIPVSGYDFYSPNTFGNMCKINDDKIVFDSENQSLIFNDKTELSVKPQVEKFKKQYSDRNGFVDVKEIPIEAKIGKYTVKILLYDLWLDKKTGEIANAGIQGFLVKKN